MVFWVEKSRRLLLLVFRGCKNHVRWQGAVVTVLETSELKPKGLSFFMRYLVPLGRIIGGIFPKESFFLALFLPSPPCMRNAEGKKKYCLGEEREAPQSKQARCWETGYFKFA